MIEAHPSPDSDGVVEPFGRPIVLIEYWYPESEDIEEAHSAPAQKQVRRVTSMLGRIRQSTFSTLELQGYISKVLYGPKFGIVYRVPEPYLGQNFYTLHDLFSTCRLMPLESRLKLAWKLSRSLLRFHAVGWLHKEVKSANVVVFVADKPAPGRLKWSDVALADAYLCGFDLSRPQEASTNLSIDFGLERNLYRHPERWGTPNTFLQKHDIYALVGHSLPCFYVSLICRSGVGYPVTGDWTVERLADLDPEKRVFKEMSKPEHLRKALPIIAGDNVAHSVGLTYSQIVCSYLRFEPQDSARQTSPNSVKFLRRNIVGVLGQLCEGFAG